MAIRIPFLADVVDLLRGTRNVADELDDLADVLRDVDEVGADAGDGLSAGMRDAARDVQASGQRIERAVRDVADDARRAGVDAGDGMRKGVAGGFDELKDEAKQSGREAAASFSGGLEDVGDFAQETIANGLAGFGPAGLVAGVALAAGVGTGLEGIRVDAERTEQRVSDMFNNMLDAGNRYQTEQQLQDATRQLADDTTQWQLALDRAGESGVEVGTVLRAMVGDSDALGIVRDGLRQKLERELELVREGADSEQIKADRVDALNTKYAASVEWLDAIVGDTDTAAAKAAAVASAWETMNTRAQALRDTVAGIVRDLDAVGKGVSIPIRADTTGIDGALRGLQGRSITVNVNGQITRIGNQVW